jgi:hypothetical protein
MPNTPYTQGFFNGRDWAQEQIIKKLEALLATIKAQQND